MKNIKLLFLILIFQSCQSQEKSQVESSNKKLNQITFEVEKPINDYKIKILWIPNYNLEEIKLLGPAIIEFKNIKSGKKYLAALSNFHIWKDIQDITYDSNGQVQKMLDNYYIIEPSEVENIISFKDVDFDNKVELILQEANNYDASSSSSNIMFYNIEENQLSKIEKEPYTIITNLEKTEFNNEKQEIILKDFYSCCEWESIHFKSLIKNGVQNFKHYKTEYHKVDTSTNIDTIKIEENGKETRIITEQIESK